MDATYENYRQYIKARRMFSLKTYLILFLWLILALIQWSLVSLLNVLRNIFYTYYYISLVSFVLAVLLFGIFIFFERLRFISVLNFVISFIIVELQIIALFALIARCFWMELLAFYAMCFVLLWLFILIGSLLPLKIDFTLDVAILFIVGFLFLIIAVFFLMVRFVISGIEMYAYIVVEVAISIIILFFIMYHAQTINGSRFAEMRLNDALLGSLLLFHDFLILYWLTFYWQYLVRPITPDVWVLLSSLEDNTNARAQTTPMGADTPSDREEEDQDDEVGEEKDKDDGKGDGGGNPQAIGRDTDESVGGRDDGQTDRNNDDDTNDTPHSGTHGPDNPSLGGGDAWKDFGDGLGPRRVPGRVRNWRFRERDHAGADPRVDPREHPEFDVGAGGGGIARGFGTDPGRDFDRSSHREDNSPDARVGADIAAARGAAESVGNSGEVNVDAGREFVDGTAGGESISPVGGRDIFESSGAVNNSGGVTDRVDGGAPGGGNFSVGEVRADLGAGDIGVGLDPGLETGVAVSVDTDRNRNSSAEGVLSGGVDDSVLVDKSFGDPSEIADRVTGGITLDNVE